MNERDMEIFRDYVDAEITDHYTKKYGEESGERVRVHLAEARDSEALATIARVRAVLDEYSDDPYAQFLAAAIRAALDGAQ